MNKMAFKSALANAVITYKQRFKKGYRGPQLGNVYIMGWSDRKKEKIKISNVNNYTINTIAVSHCLGAGDRIFISEWINGKKYKAIFVVGIDDERTFHPLRYESSIEESLVCVMHKGRDITKHIIKYTGPYGWKIANSKVLWTDISYRIGVKKIKIEINDEIVVTYADNITETQRTTQIIVLKHSLINEILGSA
jgi:hypothetical protein